MPRHYFYSLKMKKIIVTSSGLLNPLVAIRRRKFQNEMRKIQQIFIFTHSAHWPQKVTFDLFTCRFFRLGAGSSLALQYWLTHINREDSWSGYICIATSSTSAHTYKIPLWTTQNHKNGLETSWWLQTSSTIISN